MKTPMQELLEEVINAREIAMGVDFRSALDFVRDAIEQDYLEKEKEVMCEFAKLYDDDLSDGIIRTREDLFNATFNTEDEDFFESVDDLRRLREEEIQQEVISKTFNTKEKCTTK